MLARSLLHPIQPTRAEALAMDHRSYYVEYDAIQMGWGVFGSVSGFCYVLTASQSSADAAHDRLLDD